MVISPCPEGGASDHRRLAHFQVQPPITDPRMSNLTLTAYDWVSETPRGYLRDIRVRWALEETGLAYRVESAPIEDVSTGYPVPTDLNSPTEIPPPAGPPRPSKRPLCNYKTIITFTP